MKTIQFLTIAILLTACSKDWECCVTRTIDDAPAGFESLNTNSTSCVEFRGTKEEKEAFELDGTEEKEYSYPIEYTMDITTTCLPD